MIPECEGKFVMERCKISESKKPSPPHSPPLLQNFSRICASAKKTEVPIKNDLKANRTK